MRTTFTNHKERTFVLLDADVRRLELHGSIDGHLLSVEQRHDGDGGLSLGFELRHVRHKLKLVLQTLRLPLQLDDVSG